MSLWGFTFLEMVESTIGSTEQSVEEVSTAGFISDRLLSALGSRMKRQAAMIGIWNMDCILLCRSLAGAKAAQILLNKTVRVNWGRSSGVHVGGDIGKEGWAALASGLQRHPGFPTVETSRATILQAPREALKIIWDAMGALGTLSEWRVLTDRVVTVFKNGVTDNLKWEELLLLLDMS